MASTTRPATNQRWNVSRAPAGERLAERRVSDQTGESFTSARGIAPARPGARSGRPRRPAGSRHSPTPRPGARPGALDRVTAEPLLSRRDGSAKMSAARRYERDCGTNSGSDATLSSPSRVARRRWRSRSGPRRPGRRERKCRRRAGGEGPEKDLTPSSHRAAIPRRYGRAGVGREPRRAGLGANRGVAVGRRTGRCTESSSTAPSPHEASRIRRTDS